MKNYLDRLREEREDRDLNQGQIAKLIGITQSVYSKYERGNIKMPIEDLITLCKYYNTSADYILGLTKEKRAIR